ncbi:MAG: hypothetical protein WAU68_12420 [Vitreimonas sp.]
MIWTALIVVALVAFWVWLFVWGPFHAVADDAIAPAAKPAIEARSVEAWRAQREELLKAFSLEVYGPAPPVIAPVVTKREVIAPERAGGVVGVEQWGVELGAAGRFHLVLVLPPGMERAPVIVAQNFAGNRAAFPGRPEAIAAPLLYAPWITREAALDPLLSLAFGPYAAGPPFALVRERGYALALVYPGDIVPDRKREARGAMSTFARPQTGALSAWAWLHSRTLDVLAQDTRVDASRAVVWGQSRNGKAALLAAARDERFAACVALQAGRGGDALTAHRKGESVSAAMRIYGYWFTKRFARFAHFDPPVDQHQLLALIAPRPILLGHARNDAWADPAGGRAAVLGAKPVFEVFGAEPPEQYTRPGRHGIYLRDWEETLDFLDTRLSHSGRAEPRGL